MKTATLRVAVSLVFLGEKLSLRLLGSAAFLFAA
jgi:hypothetical protein